MPPLIIGADLETFQITEGALAPKPVCLTLAIGTSIGGVGNGDPEFLKGIEGLFLPGVHSVWCNAKYDLMVIAKRFPHLIPVIFRALAEGRVHDIQILEKLGNLEEHGNLKAWRGGRLGYSLADLAKRHLGVDRYAAKADAIRITFDALDGLRFSDYESEYAEYALLDAGDALAVFRVQRERWGTFKTETLQTCTDFALAWFTHHGMKLDHSAYWSLKAVVDKASLFSNFPLLLREGILRAPIPLRPYANQRKRACAILDVPPEYDFIANALPERSLECLRLKGLGIAAAKPETRDMASLRLAVVKAAGRLGIGIQMTAGTENSEPAISTTSEFLADLSDDPVIAEYAKREELAKLRTTELPRMCRLPERVEPAEIVHAPFDILKETGRTSSRADKLFPSFNGQNVDPRARGCYIPREGRVLVSVDYSAMELVTLSQKCLDLFGYSTLADVINSGIDPHAYLGTRLALEMHEGFAGACSGLTIEDAYARFMEKRETDPKFWKHWRTFAKPTGLGFPGGLGAKTFVKYAKGTFGVTVDEQTAKRLKDIWLDTYPEMRAYFRHVNDVLETGPDSYRYESPLGMVRSGATYCAACNGLGMQTPGAEGAKIAMWNIARACYDVEAGNGLLFGACWPVLFIHDEIIAEIPRDERMHERAHEIGRIMVAAMRIVCPDVSISAKPALMERWDKRAETVYDDRERLTIWRPEDE